MEVPHSIPSHLFQMQEFTKSLSYSGSEGLAIAEFKVSVSNELISDVIISFAPVKGQQDARPTVAKIPLKLMKQIAAFPLEMQGIPTQVIAKFAHSIEAAKGQSVIEQVRSQELVQ